MSRRYISVLIAVSLLASLLVTLRHGSSAATIRHDDNCLFAVTEGNDAVPVVPCAESDPLKLASHPDIRKAMDVLGLPPHIVRFQGCEKMRFSVMQEQAKDGSRRYLIRYPSNVGEAVIAPMTHELAHVFQSEMAGGLIAARKLFASSKRIELGADFLAGIVFAQALPHLPYKQFQHNIELTGLYVEPNHIAHGTPSDRTTAFRRGAFFKFDGFVKDVRTANTHFRENLYGELTSF